MQGNIIGDDFDPGVIDEINLRQSIHGSGFNKKRTPQQIQFLNNRNAWLKLASSVYVIGADTLSDFAGTAGENQLLNIEIDNNKDKIADGVERLTAIGITDPENFVGNQLAQKCVLFNSLSGAEYNADGTFKQYNQRSGVTKSKNVWNSSNSYGLGGSSMGLSPAPGLIDCSIDCVNRGSIREAKVSLKAYNKFQFELIELLYLRLGFTMMLEWGWDKYMDGDEKIQQVQTTMIEDMWFNNKAANQHSVIRNIEKYRRKYQYNYDGFFGKVSNFDWSFNSDGTYDITIDLITIGDVIESLTARNKVLALSPEQLKDAVDENSHSWNPFSKNFYVGDEGIGKLKDSSIVTSAAESSLANYMFKTILETNWAARAPGISNQGYLYSWETSREHHNSEDKSDYPEIPSEHFNYFMTFGQLLKLVQELIIPLIIKDNPECILDIEMNEDQNICSTYPNLISFNPEICLIKPHLYEEVESDKPVLALNFPNYLNDLKEFNTTNGDCVYGKLTNIYVNFQFISDTLSQVNEKGELSIFDFLKNITTGINKALGNITQLEPIIKDDYIITIIDQNPIPLLHPKNSIPTFEVFGINPSGSSTSNFVTDIKFQTSITPEVASMITIGATAGGSTKNTDATSFSKWNQGLFDRTSPAIIDNPNPPGNVTDYTNAGTKEQDEAWDKGDKVDSKWYQTGINTVITRGKNTTENIVNKDKKEQFIVNKNVTYRGLRWYNVDYTAFLTLAKGQDAAKRVYDIVSTFINSVPEVKSLKRLAKGIRIWMYDESEQYSSNYSLHLVRAFGGEINVPVSNSENKKIQIDTNDSYYNLLSEEFNNTGHQAFNGFVNTNNEKIFVETGTPSPRVGFIPMSIDLTFEGMSGIKIYNGMALRQRFLPPQYSKALKFIIEKVNHKIDSNNWSTDLSTLSVPEVNNKYASPFNNMALKSSGVNILAPVENKGPKDHFSNDYFDKPLKFFDNRDINGVPVDRSTYRKEITLDTAVSYLNKHVQTQFQDWWLYLKNNGYNDYHIYINAVYRPYSRSVELKKQNEDNAEPGKSPHNYAAGVDITIWDPSGRWFKKKERRPWIEQGFVETAKKFGLGWGGNFAGYIDAVHFFKDFNRDTALSNAAADNQGKPQKDWDTQNTKLEGNKRILKFEESKVKSRTFTWIKLEKEVGERSIGEITIMYELPDGTQKEFKGRRSKVISSTQGKGGYQDINNRLKQELLKLKSNYLKINVDKYLSNL